MPNVPGAEPMLRSRPPCVLRSCQSCGSVMTHPSSSMIQPSAFMALGVNPRASARVPVIPAPSKRSPCPPAASPRRRRAWPRCPRTTRPIGSPAGTCQSSLHLRFMLRRPRRPATRFGHRRHRQRAPRSRQYGHPARRRRLQRAVGTASWTVGLPRSGHCRPPVGSWAVRVYRVRLYRLRSPAVILWCVGGFPLPLCVGCVVGFVFCGWFLLCVWVGLDVWFGGYNFGYNLILLCVWVGFDVWFGW